MVLRNKELLILKVKECIDLVRNEMFSEENNFTTEVCKLENDFVEIYIKLIK